MIVSLGVSLSLSMCREMLLDHLGGVGHRGKALGSLKGAFVEDLFGSRLEFVRQGSALESNARFMCLKPAYARTSQSPTP